MTCLSSQNDPDARLLRNHGMRRRERGTRARASLAPRATAADLSSQRADADLLHDVARGDRTAFGQLYDRLAPSALSLGYRMLGSWGEAEDLVHDVFLECWRDASQYDPKRASVRTWILIRVRSRSIDRIRSARRTPTIGLRDALLDSPHTSDLAAGSERGKLHRVLRQLSSEQRAVVELGYFGGYSFTEIARVLEIPLGTVKSRMTRALERLRQLLGRRDRAHK